MSEEVGREVMADPTRCYAAGCEEENEIVLHLRVGPDGLADLCLTHAAQAVRSSGVVLTCDCWCCVRARHVILKMEGPQ